MGGWTNSIARRGEAVVELARHYLPDLSRESVTRTLSGFRAICRRLLERKDRRMDELSDQHERLDEERQQTEHDLDVVTGRLNEKVRQREELQQTVAAALAENDEFQSLSAAGDGGGSRTATHGGTGHRDHARGGRETARRMSRAGCFNICTRGSSARRNTGIAA